jgi:hypothetical protein
MHQYPSFVIDRAACLADLPTLFLNDLGSGAGHVHAPVEELV